MSQLLANTNSPFARYASSDIFFPVAKRPIAGQRKDGSYDLPIHGFQGVYRANPDGSPRCLGVVGDGYNPLPMRQITDTVEAALLQALPEQALSNFSVLDRVGRQGSFVERAYRFDALSKDIEYGGRYGMNSLKDGHGLKVGTTVAFLVKVATSYDGSSSIRLSDGSEDLVCDNGLVMARDIDAVARRHTKNAGLAVQHFADMLEGAVARFSKNCELWQSWAQKPVTFEAACAAIDKLPGVSKRRAKQLRTQLAKEFNDRGSNVYAVMSALTYFSSHDDGDFAVRNTGQDNAPETLVRRQEQVNLWLRSDSFQAIAA